MKKNIAYWGISILFYALYFSILRFIWNSFVPFNSMTDIISLFIIVIVNIPLSLISTEKIFSIIKEY